MFAKLLAAIALACAVTACHDATAPVYIGPGCTLKAPFSSGDLFGTVDARYDECPAPTGVQEWDLTVTDADGVTYSSHFIVVWDRRSD
ncbi:MAG: hypothetical protein JWM95_3413 [Gemmatimonadetes bacterium]|nr:hypothetical protein [Gemmatimonadota bacterium]